MMANREIGEFRRQVGKRVRSLRKACCLTQDDLADDLCIDRSRISRIETGRCALTLDEMFALADEFDVAPTALLEGIEIIGETGDPPFPAGFLTFQESF